ncbi:MAG TPA: serine/threonine-protein kinase [Kofleriaceae bacterium]
MSEPSTQLPQTQPDPELAAGTAVGEYVVEGKIGQGAFGSVWKATHPLIGKVVAIKVLARRFSVDPEIVSRFVSEARAVNQIRHRNIIDIFSFGQLPDGRHYYVMEYLDGEPLDARIERDGQLSLAAALPILRGIARALDAAHAKGIAHRDLKAENVFLATDAEGGVFPKLLDFGIAKLLAPDDNHKHKTRTGTPVGTPYYMSPEQCRGRDVDHRTDFYAFGVLTHVLLTGRYPFDADDHMSILIAQLQETAPAASSLVPELPTAIDDAIAWLLAKDPAHRPPTMRAAMTALDEAAELAGIPIGVPSAVWDAQTPLPRGGSGMRVPATTLAPAPTPARRSRWPFVAIAFVVAALAIGLVVVRVPTNPAMSNHPSPPVTTTPLASAAPAAPSAPASPASPARNVIVTITGTPAGSEIAIAGKPIGVTPGSVELPHGTAPIVITIRAKGYLPASHKVIPDREQTVAIPLKRRPATKRPGKDDIIQVFEEK